MEFSFGNWLPMGTNTRDGNNKNQNLKRKRIKIYKTQ